jgi:hypothetical protein
MTNACYPEKICFILCISCRDWNVSLGSMAFGTQHSCIIGEGSGIGVDFEPTHSYNRETVYSNYVPSRLLMKMQDLYSLLIL